MNNNKKWEMVRISNEDKEYPSNMGQKWTDEEEKILLEELNKNDYIGLQNDVKIIKNDIKEIKNTIKELVEMCICIIYLEVLLLIVLIFYFLLE